MATRHARSTHAFQRRAARPAAAGCGNTRGSSWELIEVTTALYVSPFAVAEMNALPAAELGRYVRNTLAGLRPSVRREITGGFHAAVTSCPEMLDLPRASACHALALALRHREVV